MDDMWRVIPGWEDYAASREGEIRRLKQRCDGQCAFCTAGMNSVCMAWRLGHALHPTANDWGYLRVNLRRDQKPYVRRVQCLVAAAFLGPCPEGYEVNHRDNDKTNNKVENLRYTTHSQSVVQANAAALNRPVERRNYSLSF